MVHNPTQLDYAPHSPAQQRRRRFTRAILLGSLLLGLLASLKWAGPAANHLQLLYYQHRCLANAQATQTIVLDEASSRAKVISDWERFYSLFSPPGGRFNATVFLGELRQKDGSSRLVAIDAQPRRNLDNPPAGAIDFDSRVIKPAGIWERPQARGNASWVMTAGRSGNDAILRIQAGQRDAARADHFTIVVEKVTGRVIVDGWLQSDDTILLEARGGAMSDAGE